MEQLQTKTRSFVGAHKCDRHYICTLWTEHMLCGAHHIFHTYTHSPHCVKVCRYLCWYTFMISDNRWINVRLINCISGDLYCIIQLSVKAAITSCIFCEILFSSSWIWISENAKEERKQREKEARERPHEWTAISQTNLKKIQTFSIGIVENEWLSGWL